jgi:pyruvate dehydrogenase E2 component (dihydrolipoyllysine-residue acetyltransferase)
MTDFKLPELGENVTAGDVVRILVKPGDRITKDQPVLELETDKATIEVPSSVAGTVTDVKVNTGEKVKVGQAILTVADGDGAAAEERPASKDADARGRQPQPEGAPAEGGLGQQATGERGTAPADGGERGREDRESTQSGVAEPPRAQQPRLPEDDIAGGPAKATSRQRRGEVVDISRASRPAASQTAPAAGGPPPPAAPSVRRVARELGVDIQQVPGSGAGGRITVEDVQTFVREAMSSGAGAAGEESAPGPQTPPQQPLPDFSKWGEVERKPLSNIRRKTSEHLGHAWNVIPHVTQHDKADITVLEALRQQYSPAAERDGGKLTITAIALKVLAGALRRFPQFAASIDTAHAELVFKKYVNIGVAVDTERGLLVPVIRDVEAKGIIELSVELAKASEKARAGKLSLDEMSGGVITITNLGGIGGTAFTPIVNWPEVAILGISRSSEDPVWNGSAFEPRLMLPLSLSYDHRVIDGADAARFLRWVAQAFEQPLVLAL